MKYKIPPSTAMKQTEVEKLSNLEKFVLDAYIVSNISASEKVMLAYELSRPNGSEANRQSLYMQARKWITTKKCKYYIELRKQELFEQERRNSHKPEKEEGEEGTMVTYSKRTKSETLEELNELASKTSDPKLKTEILIKISDLEGWKKEIEKTDDNTIRYYLPLKCNICEHYKCAMLSRST